MASPPPCDLRGYEPPVCLWSLVCDFVPEYEREEIKNMLGESLVEQSLELHEEVETLLEIWREVHDESIKSVNKNRLPEPPELRERLRQEIKFFVENLKLKAERNGRDPKMVLSRHNTEVIEYAVERSRPQTADFNSRPSTAFSVRDGRETPMRHTPSSDKLSSASTLSEELDSMNDKLNVLKLDEVVQHLRETLEEEISWLLSDIQFLQGCLEEEADFRDNSPSVPSEPTLSDLKRERTLLEKELLVTDTLPPSKPPLGVRTISNPSMKPKLSPIDGAARKLTPPLTSPLRGHTSDISLRKVIKSEPSSPVHSRQGSAESPARRLSGNTLAHGRPVARVKLREGEPAQVTNFTAPSPPSSAKPSKTGSAARFRKMVVDVRQDS